MRRLVTLLGLLMLLAACTTVEARPINVSWTPGTGPGDPTTAFNVERKVDTTTACTSATPVFTEIATTPANTPSYIDLAVTVGTIYCYRVRASNAGGFSAYSNVAGAAALPAPPNTPQNLQLGAVPSIPALVGYVDPAALDVPWPMHSHWKQPWRGWDATVSATTLRDGIGLNYHWHVPRDHAADLARYGAAGVRRIRVEVSWNQADFISGALTGTAVSQLRAIIQAAQANGIRPLLLLNANHQGPTPSLAFQRTVTLAAARDARTLRVNAITGIVPHYTGLTGVPGGDDKMAGILVTAVNGTALTLSKPLPGAIGLNATVQFHTLFARPLFEVTGSTAAFFDETLSRWLAYVRSVIQTVQSAGVASFDVEVWNELVFGSDFLYHDRYYTPPLVPAPGDTTIGGRVLTFAQRTAQMLRAEFPGVTPIFGYSNTAFFSFGWPPPEFGGQSYHPYYFYLYPEDGEQYGFSNNVDGYTPPPPYRVRMPEAAITLLKTESLVRLMAPGVSPVGFQHYMTEHGVNPPELGVTGAAADRLKIVTVLRSAVAFLHRGLTGLYFFADLGNNAMDLDPVALPALGRLTAPLRTAVAVPSPAPVSVAVALAGQVYPGDATHPPLLLRDVLAVFVYQAGPTRFLVATYVMTRDLTVPLPATPATVRLGLDGRSATVTATDPLDGAAVPVTILERTPTSLTLALAVTDSPRWVEIAG